MKKNKRWLFKVATFLLSAAPILIESTASRLAVGEPEIPKHYKK